MALWLFKEEPTHYSFSDLQRDGRTVWDGIENALAQQHLRRVRRGDRILFYHTGKEKAVVGTMRVVTNPTATEDGKGVLVQVEAGRPLARPVTLAQIKTDPAFAGWDLIRLSRLSVMPVTKAQWDRVVELSKQK
jgi:predicted RNA-binding protein with PUA-like domain